MTCWLALAATSAAAVGIGGCGGGVQRRAPALTLPTRISRLEPTAPLPPPAADGQPVGDSEQIHAGTVTLAVTVTQVIDPLTDSGASLQPGTRAIGVRVQIVNRGPGVYDSSATGDFSVVPSSGPATPVFEPSGVCRTPLQDFDNAIAAGETRSGCVAFAVPQRAVIEAIHFAPHADARHRLSWVVGR